MNSMVIAHSYGAVCQRLNLSASVIEVQQKRRSPLGGRVIKAISYCWLYIPFYPHKNTHMFCQISISMENHPIGNGGYKYPMISPLKLTRIPIKSYKTDEIHHVSMANHPYLPCHRPPFGSKPLGSWRTAELTEASLIRGLAGQGWGDKPGEGGSYYPLVN